MVDVACLRLVVSKTSVRPNAKLLFTQLTLEVLGCGDKGSEVVLHTKSSGLG